MPSKTKKAKASGRFGARYGKTPRFRLSQIEEKQRIKQKCPLCGKMGVKRVSKGVWKCAKCNKKFASNTFYLD
jgi:large subunit ribosomal protein L37Ae